MIEYRQYVPEGSPLKRQIIQNVAAELSRWASRRNDPDEFYIEALSNVTERPSRKGGLWVHSWLDREPRARYLDTGYRAPFKVPVPFAKVHDPVDMTPDELEAHMQEKASRR